MKKKKWRRSPAAKGILLVLQYLLLGIAVFTGLFVFTLERHDIRLSDSDGDFIDSEAFTSTLYQASYEIMHAISGTFPYTDEIQSLLQSSRQNVSDSTSTTNVSKSTAVVDLDEVVNDDELSFTNVSGLAYSLSDLENWAENYDYYSDNSAENPIVVCHKTSDTKGSQQLSMHYYYANDFLEKIDSGELNFKVMQDPSDEYGMTEDELADFQADLLSDVRYGIQYGTWDSDSVQITDKDDTTVYDQIYSYQGFTTAEIFTPQGADSILDVLNNNKQWNDRIDDAFMGLSNILSRIGSYVEQNKLLEDYKLDSSNIGYVYINEDTGTVVSNDSELENTQLKYKKSAADTDYYDKLLDILHDKTGFSYILIQAQPNGFATNVKTIQRGFHIIGIDYSPATWRDMAYSTLPEVNDNFIFAVYVDQNFPVTDAFTSAKLTFDSYASYLRPVFFLCILCLVLFLLSFILLTTAAGRNNRDEELHLCFFDRWPTEISVGIVLLGWFSPVVQILQNLPFTNYQIARLQASLIDVYFLIQLLIFFLYTLFWFQIGYLSLVRRIKGKLLWKNSVLRWLLRMMRKGGKKGLEAVHTLIDFYSRNTASKLKVIFAFLGFVFFKYLVFGPSFGNVKRFFFFSCFVDLLILVFAIRKALHQEQLLKGLKEISSGNLQYKIPLEKLSGEDKVMAEYINNVGSGLDAAVENSVKNERMKTELITNVSHDLKTPLTSIISYIDLLKRENFTDPKICEYLDILEAKAARLKVLTEDVVEASKASTGNLTLNMTEIDFVEMLHQVIGEFEERFQEHQLTMMVHFPDKPSMIYADGQRMWRVLENVFGNVTKYAMEGTRVYAEVQNASDQVIFSLKNISAQPLNFAAEELTERFVRGDVARNTEGSGLGLSIAKSLTELQGGKFQLYLDGDLFKVTITFKAQKTKATLLPEQPAPDAR